MEVAADIGEGDEGREFVVGGGIDFAAVFAEFGRDEGEAEFFIDVFFGFACDRFDGGGLTGLFVGFVVFGEFVEAPFVECEVVV